jgi:hypothetical protein
LSKNSSTPTSSNDFKLSVAGGVNLIVTQPFCLFLFFLLGKKTLKYKRNMHLQLYCVMVILCIAAYRGTSIKVGVVSASSRGSTGSGTCATTAASNVTDGEPAGAKKFTVSATDCCDYCASVPSCTAAVFASYYCAPFSSVVSTGPAAAATIVTIATTTTSTTTTAVPTTTTTTAAPTTTTAAPATPVPFTPVPQRGTTSFAYLTTCPEALNCGISIYACTSIVVQLNTCSYNAQNGGYMLAQNFSNAITLTEYKAESAGCDDRNAIVKAANFPLQCSFNNEGNSVVGFVQTIDEGLNSGKYDVYQDTFYEDVCSSFSGALSFNTTTGTCIEAAPQTPVPGAASSSSSTSSSSSSTSKSSGGGPFVPINPLVGAAQKVFCVGNSEMLGMVIFAYPTLSACAQNMPVVGMSMIANTCFSTMYNAGHYTYNSCRQAAASRR